MSRAGLLLGQALGVRLKQHAVAKQTKLSDYCRSSFVVVELDVAAG